MILFLVLHRRNLYWSKSWASWVRWGWQFCLPCTTTPPDHSSSLHLLSAMWADLPAGGRPSLWWIAPHPARQKRERRIVWKWPKNKQILLIFIKILPYRLNCSYRPGRLKHIIECIHNFLYRTTENKTIIVTKLQLHNARSAAFYVKCYLKIP